MLKELEAYFTTDNLNTELITNLKFYSANTPYKVNDTTNTIPYADILVPTK